MTDRLLTLTDRAFDATMALTTIKSFAYGGLASEQEARASAAALREQVQQIEALLDGQAQEPLSR